MYKTAPHSKAQQSFTRQRALDQDVRSDKEEISTNQKPQDGIHRRDFIKRTGLALAGVTAASTFLQSVRRGMAAGTNSTEITFSSAKFYGKETIAEVVDEQPLCRAHSVLHRERAQSPATDILLTLGA